MEIFETNKQRKEEDTPTTTPPGRSAENRAGRTLQQPDGVNNHPCWCLMPLSPSPLCLVWPFPPPFGWCCIPMCKCVSRNSVIEVNFFWLSNFRSRVEKPPTPTGGRDTAAPAKGGGREAPKHRRRERRGKEEGEGAAPLKRRRKTPLPHQRMERKAPPPNERRRKHHPHTRQLQTKPNRTYTDPSHRKPHTHTPHSLLFFLCF